ncbi:ABC transporter permease [Desulforhopalus singaporensis]|uniref:Thiamine transport system permease protein n=1 Tax=Desulforhopalus singaporensis TaxID=91360 RepID=A0A1H0J6E4_9BACT|nr:iron ABC transporter permease [Desulforhopalus singaporensis]SDO39059.1 thiamine transport system permease protein [Desulforhopalus singaporensis]
MVLRRPVIRWLLFSLPLLFLAVFYFFPLSRIIGLSLSQDGGLQTTVLQKLFGSGTYGKILWFSIWQAALSTILTLVFALPGAYVFAKYSFRGKAVFQALMTVPFVMPTVVTAAAFRALLGQNGLVNHWSMSMFGLSEPVIDIDQTIVFFLLAHIFYNYTLVVRMVSSFWSTIDHKVVAAARMLGASPMAAFRTVTLPLLMPAIGSAALLVFTFCFTSFGVILILGGPRFSTLEVEIYRQTVQLFNLPMAATLAIIQLVFNFLLMWLHARLAKRTKVSFFAGDVSNTQSDPESAAKRSFAFFNLSFMILLLATPLIALIIRSFSGEDGFTLLYYTTLFTRDDTSLLMVEPIASVKNSILFGFGAMSIALSLGLLAATFLSDNSGKNIAFWDAVIMLPLATSAVTLGFGYIVALNKPPVNLRDSLLLVPLAHALVAFPFVVRCLLPSLRQIPADLREAATLLGASPFRVWRLIDIPLLRKAILVAAIFAFAISMGEFGASAFVARPHTPTMPVAIFRFLSHPGSLNYGQAMAMSTILMVVTCISFWLAEKLEARLADTRYVK